MRVLIVTKIFPNPVEPLSCPFNRQQFGALEELCDVSLFATIPWFPGARLFRRWSAAGKLADVPRRSTVDGMEVQHPRYLYLPRFGHPMAGALYAASVAPHASLLKGQVDVVLGSWLYPDGFAAVLLARLLGVPSVIKVHGSDLNSLPALSGLSRPIRWTLRSADRIITVSKPLRRRAIEFGAASEKVDIVRNGVDSALFRLRSRSQARARLGLPGDRKLALFVGRLERAKGVHALLDAFTKVKDRRTDLSLVFVGDGSARSDCERAALTNPGRIFVVGPRNLKEIPLYMAASDLLALPSENEGTPNVILEAFACGRKVVATAVGGIPDLVTSPHLGELVPRGDTRRLAQAIARVIDAPYDAHVVRKHSRVQSWEDSAAELHESLVLCVSQRGWLSRFSGSRFDEGTIKA